jgi:DNA-binding NarL/FixJ family response regulator
MQRELLIQLSAVFTPPTIPSDPDSFTTSETIERPPEPVEPLTRREIDVLRLLARGNTNRQIAELLALSIRTIESHRANLMGKLGLTSRVELVTYAEEHGLL